MTHHDTAPFTGRHQAAQRRRAARRRSRRSLLALLAVVGLLVGPAAAADIGPDPTGITSAPAPAGGIDPDLPPVLGPPDLGVGGELAETRPSVAVGSLAVLNSGERAATAVTLTIDIPVGTVLTSARSRLGESGLKACPIEPDGRQAVCRIAELGAGEQLDVTVVVANRDLPAGSTVELRAAATSDQPDAWPDDDKALLPVIFSGDGIDAGTVSVGLSPGAEQPAFHPSVWRGSLVVGNGGPAAATGVTVRVQVPEGTTVAWTGPTGDPSADAEFICPTGPAGRELVCTLAGPLAPPVVSVLPVVVLNVGLPAGSVIEVVATVTTEQPDTDPTDDGLTVPVTFAGGPVPGADGSGANDVAVVADPTAEYHAGDWAVGGWTITGVGLTSPGTITAQIRLMPGPSLLRVGLTGEDGGQGTCAITLEQITCTLAGPLPPVSTARLVVVLSHGFAPRPTRLWAEAVVAGDAPDPDPDDNRAVIDLGVVTTPAGGYGTPDGPA